MNLKKMANIDDYYLNFLKQNQTQKSVVDDKFKGIADLQIKTGSINFESVSFCGIPNRYAGL